jgi:hypothetical protein
MPRTPIDIAKDFKMGLSRAHQDTVAIQLSCLLAVSGAYAPTEAADPGANSSGSKLSDAQKAAMRSVIVSSHTDEELYQYEGDRRGYLAADEAVRLRLDPTKLHPYEKIRHVEVDRRKMLALVVAFLQGQAPGPDASGSDATPKPAPQNA